MLPSMFAKLFSRIAQSSLMEEDVETRYCFMMLLAIADSGGDVIGTDVALARTVNLPLDTFKRCVGQLMEPDPDSNSQVHHGRRVVLSESGRGYLIVNYVTYREIKTADEKKAYMREYMRMRRKALKDKDVTAVNQCKKVLTDVTQAEGEGEAEEEGEREAILPPTPTASTKPAGVREGKDSTNLPTTPQSKRIAAVFHRRETTPWTAKEVTAYRAIGTVPEEDLRAVERYYGHHWPPTRGQNILRTDLLTFLNNFPGELGRAHAWLAESPQKPPVKTHYLPGLGQVPIRDVH